VQFVEAIPSKPYPREDAIQASIEDLRTAVPKLDGMKAADFVDASLIREIDSEGFSRVWRSHEIPGRVYDTGNWHILGVACWPCPRKIRIGVSAVSLGFLPTVIAERRGFSQSMDWRRSTLVPLRRRDQRDSFRDLDYNVCTGPGVAGAIKGCRSNW
jgi:hypothetical protein